MQTIQHHLIFKFINSHRKSVLLTFSIGLLANLMTIFIPMVITLSYAILFNVQGNKAQVLTNGLGFEPNFQAFIMLFFASILLKGFLDFALKYNMGKMSEQLIFELRGQLFEHQLNVNMEEYDKRGMGRYLLRYSGDLSSIHGYLTKGIIRFAADALMLCISFLVLWQIYPLLTTVLLGWFALMSVIVNYLNNIFYNITEHRRNRKSSLLSFINQRLMSMLSLQTFNKERPELSKFYKRTTEIHQIGNEYQRIAAFIQSLIPLMMYGMIGIVLLFVFFEKKQPNATLDSEMLLLIVLMLISLLPFFRRLLSVNMVWKKGKISIRKLTNILDLATNIFQNEPDLIFEKGEIKIDQLHFQYKKGKPVIENLSFTLQSNEIHQIKGVAGSGKTTLIKLLSAIYYPTSGSIMIDNQSSTAVNPKSWRKQVAIVADEWQFYGRNVFEAISYGKSKKYKKRATSILKKLQKGIEEPLTIKTRTGDFGAKLSKSERKLLMYVRALMTRKPILVIDQPFDSMDAVMQSHFINLLIDLKKKHTIILIENEPLGIEVNQVIDLSESEVISS